MTQSAMINYAMYWHTLNWPSDTNRDSQGQPTFTAVSQMPPQQAAASLAKMLRWVHTNPVGQQVGQDLDTREEYARKTELGLALAARALGLTNGEEVYALYSEASDLRLAESIATKEVLEVVFDVLEHSHPLANAADIGRVAGEVTGYLINRFQISRLPQP